MINESASSHQHRTLTLLIILIITKTQDVPLSKTSQIKALKLICFIWIPCVWVSYTLFRDIESHFVKHY